MNEGIIFKLFKEHAQHVRALVWIASLYFDFVDIIILWVRRN